MKNAARPTRDAALAARLQADPALRTKIEASQATFRAYVDTLPPAWKPEKLMTEVCPPDMLARVLESEARIENYCPADHQRVGDLIYVDGPDAVRGRKVRHADAPPNPDKPPHRAPHPAAELWVKLTYQLMKRRRFQSIPDRRRKKAARNEAARLIDNHFRLRRQSLSRKVAPLLGGDDDDVSTKFKRAEDRFGSPA